MKNKKILTFGLIGVLVFILTSSYLWYENFDDYVEKTIDEVKINSFQGGVELSNSGAIDYINATNDDEDDIVPAYYFRVRNTTNKDYNYILYIENVQGTDGCTAETTFSRDELEYELILDNKIVRKEGLNTISNNILDENIVKANDINDYSLKVRVKNIVDDYSGKHFHYTISIKEKK